jgi:hypothetical protein
LSHLSGRALLHSLVEESSCLYSVVFKMSLRPSCKSVDLERLLSSSAISSDNTRQLSFNKARARAKFAQRDKDVAQAEYEKKHREEGH